MMLFCYTIYLFYVIIRSAAKVVNIKRIVLTKLVRGFGEYSQSIRVLTDVNQVSVAVSCNIEGIRLKPTLYARCTVEFVQRSTRKIYKSFFHSFFFCHSTFSKVAG